MPRRSRRLNPPCHLDALSDEVVIRVFLRAPFVTHGTLHVVCRRLKTLLQSREFLQQRVDSGLAEYGILEAGGCQDNTVSCCQMLSLWDGWRHRPENCDLSWRPAATMRCPRQEFCSLVVKDEDGRHEMWAMGGRERAAETDVDLDGENLGLDEEIHGENLLNTVEIYSPKTNAWRSGVMMRNIRDGAVAGVVSGYPVVAGGFDGNVRLSSAEAFDGAAWCDIPPMPFRTLFATACVLDEKMYVIGGVQRSQLQVLEKTEDGWLWTCKADLPAPRYAAASIAHDGKIWVIGGNLEDHEGSTSVIIYDPATDTWATGAPLPHPVQWGRAFSRSDLVTPHPQVRAARVRAEARPLAFHHRLVPLVMEKLPPPPPGTQQQFDHQWTIDLFAGWSNSRLACAFNNFPSFAVWEKLLLG
jgi:hypothetical protein